MSCPSCGECLWIPDEYRGRAGRCHACASPVTAPAAEATPNQVPCSVCGVVLFIPDEHLGKRGRCYACGAVVDAATAPAVDANPVAADEPQLVPASCAPEQGLALECPEPAVAALVDLAPDEAEASAAPEVGEPPATMADVSAEVMAPADPPTILDSPVSRPSPPPRNGPTTALGLWAVLLERQIDAAVHKDALAQAMKVTPADAAHRIREGQGILSTLLTDELAEDVLAALRRGGVAARAVLADQLAPLPAAIRARKLTWSSSNLVAHPDGGLAPIAVPWDALRVIHCGRVVEPALKARSVSPAPLAFSPIGRVARGAAALASVESAGIRGSATDGGDLIADLVSLEPAVRLRLDARYLDFSVLGPARESTAPPNLRLTLREILSRCPRITANLSRQELDAQGPFEPPRYEGQDLFDRRTMWMLNLALSREAQDN